MITKYNQQKKERIEDGVDLNNFGILLHDMKTIEIFQQRSGMEGAYTTEYQHHYINAVGRIEAEGQILDVAVPLVLYNYHQEVAGASVEFNLKEVGNADRENKDLAVEKFKEFEATPMFTALAEMGISQWSIEGMNSVHAHPANINRFSGTDLRANIDHPGVNFPLNIGTNLANFASIIQHKSLFAELIHTEYRIFNGEEEGLRSYKKGRCLTIIRGYEAPPAPEPIPDGLIDKIFGTSRPKPPTPSRKERKSSMLKDGLSAKEGDAIGEELSALWKTCEFSPDVSSVLKTNVLKGIGRLQKKTTTSYAHHNAQKSLLEKEEDWGYSTHRQRAANKKDEKRSELVLDEITLHRIKYLREAGYNLMDLSQWTNDDVKDTYEEEVKEVEELEKDQVEEEDVSEFEMKKALESHGYKYYQMNTWDNEQLLNTYELLCLYENDEVTVEKKEVKKDRTTILRSEMITELVEEKVFRLEILEPMVYQEIRALYVEIFPQAKG